MQLSSFIFGGEFFTLFGINGFGSAVGLGGVRIGLFFGGENEADRCNYNDN